jgi:hypothetical protein
MNKAPEFSPRRLILSLGADNQFFQIQIHQMLEIGVQIFFGKNGEKFWLGAFVDFTNAIYQLPFTHMHTSFKTSKPH